MQRLVTAGLWLALLLFVTAAGANTLQAQAPADKLPKTKQLVGEWYLTGVRAINEKGQDITTPEMLQEIDYMQKDFATEQISIQFVNAQYCVLKEKGDGDQAPYSIKGNIIRIAEGDNNDTVDLTYDKKRKALVYVLEEESDGETGLYLLGYFTKKK